MDSLGSSMASAAGSEAEGISRLVSGILGQRLLLFLWAAQCVDRKAKASSRGSQPDNADDAGN